MSFLANIYFGINFKCAFCFNIRLVHLPDISFVKQMTADDVYLSFLPLAHILDCMIEEYFFYRGASVGYYHGVCYRSSVSLRNSLVKEM